MTSQALPLSDKMPCWPYRLKYMIPTRGLIGLRNAMLTATKGTAVLNTIFAGYQPWCGELATRDNGSLTAHETGQVSMYSTRLHCES